MVGGDILQQRDGHPTRGNYWFPAFNSSAGLKALSFIQDQVTAGIKPQKEHYWGKEFIDRKYAVMIEGSWMPSYMEQPIQDSIDRIEFENQIRFLPMFPVPDKSNQTATLMGGSEFGIPNTSLQGFGMEINHGNAGTKYPYTMVGGTRFSADTNINRGGEIPFPNSSLHPSLR